MTLISPLSRKKEGRKERKMVEMVFRRLGKGKSRRTRGQGAAGKRQWQRNLASRSIRLVSPPLLPLCTRTGRWTDLINSWHGEEGLPCTHLPMLKRREGRGDLAGLMAP